MAGPLTSIQSMLDRFVQMAAFQDPEEVKANLDQLCEYQLQVNIGSSNT